MTRAALAIALALLAGCVTEGPPPSSQPEPRTIPQPAGLEVERITMSAEPVAIDTDDNGYGDTFRVSVFLFPDARVHPLPIHAEGRVLFALLDDQNEALAQWEFDEDRVDRAKVRPLVGPAYVFELRLEEAGLDRLPVGRANLTCAFVPADGSGLVRSRGVATIQMGPSRLGG